MSSQSALDSRDPDSHACVPSLWAAGPDISQPMNMRVYIGTYSRGGSQGIYQTELNLASGELSPPRLAAEAVNPSFLAIHPSRKFLYSVTELTSADGTKSGGVNAFSIDPHSGQLTLLNQQSSKGVGPCHVTVDRS